MSGKSISFERPDKTPASAEEWVTGKPEKAEKRLSIVMSETMHRRIKARCVERGQSMTEVLIDILERAFPEVEHSTNRESDKSAS